MAQKPNKWHANGEPRRSNKNIAGLKYNEGGKLKQVKLNGYRRPA